MQSIWVANILYKNKITKNSHEKMKYIAKKLNLNG